MFVVDFGGGCDLFCLVICYLIILRVWVWCRLFACPFVGCLVCSCLVCFGCCLVWMFGLFSVVFCLFAYFVL